MNLKWLVPGLGVKRWFLVSVSGMGLAGAGVALLLYPFASGWSRWILNGGTAGGIVALVLLAIGSTLVGFGFYRMLRSVVREVMPHNQERLVDVLYQRRALERGPRVVAIGGGTGLSVLLRGFKQYTSNITAIVAVSDDGGSSGRLRGELGIQPPGDLRNCLVALADTENLMERVLDYRFSQGSGLAGHSLGNLILAGMADITGDLERAAQQISKVLAVRGRVLPATLEHLTLVAELEDGRQVMGESSITAAGGHIRRLSVKPVDSRPLPGALDAIAAADLVVLGPGSLYTSILPNLLLVGVAEALRRTRAPVFYTCNVMTEPGETDGHTAAEHLRRIVDHCGPGLVDYMVVNTKPVSPATRRKYRQSGAVPVRIDVNRIRELGAYVVKGRLLDEDTVARHHPERLARCILGQYINHRAREAGRWRRLASRGVSGGGVFFHPDEG